MKLNSVEDPFEKLKGPFHTYNIGSLWFSNKLENGFQSSRDAHAHVFQTHVASIDDISQTKDPNEKLQNTHFISPWATIERGCYMDGNFSQISQMGLQQNSISSPASKYMNGFAAPKTIVFYFYEILL